jgi:hypothetical protein
MTDDPKFVVHTFPMLDTGIGREMGYEDDKAFIAAAEAERAKLDPAVRAALDQADRDLERAFLYGTPRPAEEQR